MPDTSDRKFQDGDLVVHNEYNDETRASEGRVLSIYTVAGKSRGDWAYTVEFTSGYVLRKGQKPYKTQVWGHYLKNAMFKYDPKQAGDTEDDV